MEGRRLAGSGFRVKAMRAWVCVCSVRTRAGPRQAVVQPFAASRRPPAQPAQQAVRRAQTSKSLRAHHGGNCQRRTVTPSRLSTSWASSVVDHLISNSWTALYPRGPQHSVRRGGAPWTFAAGSGHPTTQMNGRMCRSPRFMRSQSLKGSPATHSRNNSASPDPCLHTQTHTLLPPLPQNNSLPLSVRGATKATGSPPATLPLRIVEIRVIDHGRIWGELGALVFSKKREHRWGDRE